MSLTFEQIKISRFLSLILRHKPEKANIVLDKEGWADVSDILLNLHISMNDLDLIVELNDKKRFSYNETKTKIRALQGHSLTNLELNFKEEKNVPNILFHGTKKEFIKSIMKNGLQKMRRTHVHLSIDEQTAKKVADRRKGESIILKIDALKMRAERYKFYKSENGVYLTDTIPAKYISY